MSRPFARHAQRFYAPRPSWGKRATINGRPAHEVVAERQATLTPTAKEN